MVTHEARVAAVKERARARQYVQPYVAVGAVR